jgi:hypothetical protein
MNARATMSIERLQIAVWIMLPVLGLLLLVLAIGARGGIFMLPIVGLFLLLFILPLWLAQNQDSGS